MVATAAIVVATIPLAILAASGHRLIPLLLGNTHINLIFSPNGLQVQEVIMAMLTMVGRSMYRAIARISSLPSTETASQELTVRCPFRVEQEDEARYLHATRPNDNSKDPIESSHLMLFLSAMTEPAMLLLLTSPQCPVNPLGAVNVRNRFELLRPDLCSPLSFRDSGQTVLFARVHRESRLVKRGIEYDLEVGILAPDDATNDKTVFVFRQIFTMLEFRKTKGRNAEEKSAENKIPGEQPQSSEPAIQVSLSDSDPWRWAALCKDYNLIHLSGMAARLYELPGKLAHGNHVVARALQALLETSSIRSLGGASTWMEVQFKRPVRVPAELNVEITASSPATTRIVITNNGRPVTAEYGPS